MKKLSLRLRLIIFFALVSGIVFSAAAFVSWQETSEKIDEFFDTYQMALARQLASADWSTATPDVQKITNKLIKRINHADDEDEAIGFAVFDKQGKMVFHDNENGKDFFFAPYVGNFIKQPVDGEEWRIVWLASADGKYVIAVGQELDYRNDIVWEMTEEFILPWGVGICILLLLMILIITMEFRPLNRLASNLVRRSADDLSPLTEEKLPSEIRPLITSMNVLFEKINNMLERERGFIADSAHELRTPLTALKVQLEVLQLAQDDEYVRKEALLKLAAGIDRSARLVEQLLSLSKAESSQQSAIKEKIFWPQVISPLMDEYQEAAEAKHINLYYSDNGSGPFAEGNPLLAALIVRNLFDNAVKYSPDGAEVRIETGNGTLSVINTPAQVAEKHLSLLGRRFYRPAGQKQTGSGLGLSIVSRISELYGCTLRLRNVDNGFEAKIS